MRSPNKRIKSIRIRYQQVPYNGRYYYIDVKDKVFGGWINISKIQHCPDEIFQANYLPYIFYLENGLNTINKFLDELNLAVKQYDDYLER